MYSIKMSPLVWLLICFCFACSQKIKVDLLVKNAHIYLVDSSFQTAEAMVISNGKVIATGSNQILTNTYLPAEAIDAGGNFIYPGFIDAHCHFLAYGKGLNECNLTGTNSWSAILDSLKSFSRANQTGWLIGRGWDQNDWNDKSFPTNEKLDSLFPTRPVILTRIDGHAAVANSKALKLADIKNGQTITGGEIISNKGRLTGLLVDNATELVEKIIPTPTQNELTQFLLDA